MTNSSSAEPKENDEPLVEDTLAEAGLEEISSFQSFSIFWVELMGKLSGRSKSLQQNPLLARVARFLQALPILKEIVFILHPAMTWQRIADNPRSWVSVFIKYLMPMLLLLWIVLLSSWPSVLFCFTVTSVVVAWMLLWSLMLLALPLQHQ